MHSFRNTWSIIAQTGSDFIANRTLKLSAALAYYTVFSLPGLMIILIWIGDRFYSKVALEGRIYSEIGDIIGKSAAFQIQDLIRKTSFAGEGGWVKTIGVITLIIGASSIFAEIQDSIDLIWHIRAKPGKGMGLIRFVINRLLSFSMVASLGFLLLVSLALNGLIEALMGQLSHYFPAMKLLIAYLVNWVITFLLTSLLFGMIFKVLPNARIERGPVIVGAIFTTILFMASRFLITYYLSHTSMTSAYGAAGSVIIILLWVYYSSILLYLGAAFTRVYALKKGTPIYPNIYAVSFEEVVQERANMDSKK